MHIKRTQKSFVKKIFIAIFVIIALIFTYIYLIKQPSNNRNWGSGFEKLAGITVYGDKVTVQNVRRLKDNSSYKLDYSYSPRIINSNDVTSAWFVFEPFPVKWLPGFNGIAHTYFIFDVKKSSPIAVSVEARRERGENYTAEAGLFNNYELIIIWDSEEDALIQRSVFRNEKQYMFPLEITQKQAKALFLQMAKDTNFLENHPRFYNSLFSNCTNELAKAANELKPGTIPLNIAMFFPGYSDSELYKLGLIPDDKSLSEIKKKFYVTDEIKKIYKDPNFSEELRDFLR